MLRNEKRKNGINCYKNLVSREYNSKFAHNICLYALKSLIGQKNYEYRKVWEKSSSKNITSEHGRIYFDNYTEVYGGYAKDNRPVHLYNLKSQKIENALTCVSRTSEFGLPHDGERDCLLCVTKGNNRLLRVHLTSGKILQDIFLSSFYNFRDISWNDAQSSIVVRSTKSNRHGQTDVVKAMAVFDVKPLQFVGMLEITKQIFGKTTVDAGLCQSVLITMHQQCKVKMYSFYRILEKYRTAIYKLNDVIDDEGNRLGQQPVGLKVNIKITEQPPILFEVSCYDHIVEFSNKPFHYLYSPSKLPEFFEVHSLDNGSQIKNGKLDTGVSSCEQYRASFWNDDSGRVMHIATSLISFYDLVGVPEEENGEKMLKKCFEINMQEDKCKTDIPFTSSGRKINRPHRTDSIDTDESITIYNVDYEDDLDLICVTAVYHDKKKDVVGFYDNKTGKHLKEVSIEKCSEILEHRTFIDLDTIIQITKLWSGKFHCSLYRLTDTRFEEHEVNLKASKQTTRPSSRRTRTRLSNR